MKSFLISISFILLIALSLQSTEIIAGIFFDSRKAQTNSSMETERARAEDGNFDFENSTIPVIKPSDLIAALRKKKKENPNISAKELADFGNELLKTGGYDYTFSWEPKGKENKDLLRKMDLQNYFPFKYGFYDRKGKKINFQLMNNSFEHPCFSVIDIPVTKVTEQNMTVISGGREIELKRPKDFYLEEFVLVDKTLKKPIRKWKTPIDALPVGISEDGKSVYFNSWEFDQDESDHYKESILKLAVKLSVDGQLKLVDLNEIKSDKGINIGNDEKYPEITYNKYKAGKNEYIIKSSGPCT